MSEGRWRRPVPQVRAVLRALDTLEARYSGQAASGKHRVTIIWAQPKGTWQIVTVHMTRIP